MREDFVERHDKNVKELERMTVNNLRSYTEGTVACINQFLGEEEEELASYIEEMRILKKQIEAHIEKMERYGIRI